MSDSTPTAVELRELLITLLSGATGRGHWRRAIESVEVHPLSTHISCNWTVRTTGLAADQEAIGKAVAIVRAAHPYARSD